MNPYAMLGSGIGTADAGSLTARLSAWHDAMVAHERRLRAGTTSDRCDDECPHAEARALWSEAVAAFGSRASELAFLRSRANETSRRLKADLPPQGAGADTAANANRPPAAPGRVSSRERPGGARAAAEL